MTDQLIEIPNSASGADGEETAQGTYRLYWYGPGMKKTRNEAYSFAASRGNGHQLADIPNASWRDSAAKYLNGPAWIYSWRGDSYSEGNVVLHPNGSIGTLEDGNQQLPFLISYIQ